MPYNVQINSFDPLLYTVAVGEGAAGPTGASGPPGPTANSLPGPALFAEVFPDTDGTIIADGPIGRQSQTGHPLIADGTGATDRRAVVNGGEQSWMTLPLNGAPIGILGPSLTRLPTAVRSVFRYASAGTTNTANCVMGVAGGPGATGTPSFAQGSIQLSVYPTYAQIFVVQNPIVDPYPVIGLVAFANPLVTGSLVDMMMVHDPEAHTVTASVVTAENGVSRIPAIDCRISGIDYWSPAPDGRSRFAWQLRRQASTDGEWRCQGAWAA